VTEEATKLLTIEDEATVRRSIAAFFEDSGFQVFQAENGRIGIEVFEREQPDVVLCDLRMPEMDGLTVLETLATHAPETPFIVVSGTGEMGDAIRALKSGAWDYITKPIHDLEVLEHAVSKSLEQARLRRENREYSERLENANRELERSLKRLQEDEAAARRIQFQLLPEAEARHQDYCFERYLKTSAYLSGDFLDHFPIDANRTAFYFADVSGHGVSSAFITVLLKSTMDHLRDRFVEGEDAAVLDPARVLEAISQSILQQNVDKYLTMFYAVLDRSEQTIAFANGGQWPNPILCDGRGPRFLTAKKPPVGLFAGVRFETETIALPDCFVLAMFSDGVFDILPQETLKEKNAYLLEQVSGVDVRLDRLIQTLELGSLKAPLDDITLLLVRRGGQNG